MRLLRPSAGLLRQVARQVPVDQITAPRFRELCNELLEFVSDQNAHAGAGRQRVGVAATQVGVDYAIAVVNLAKPDGWSKKMRVLINPRIVRQWGPRQVKWWHGCESAGDLVSVIVLPRYMEVEYYDRRGRLQTWKIDGIKDGARLLHVVWHHIEHLFGVRHVDRAIEYNVPIYVVTKAEQSLFVPHFYKGDYGKIWPRTLNPSGWRAIYTGRGWQRFIIHRTG